LAVKVTPIAFVLMIVGLGIGAAGGYAIGSAQVYPLLRQIGDLQDQVIGLRSQVVSRGNYITSLEGNVTSLKDNVTRLQAENHVLRQNVSDLQAGIQAMAAYLAGEVGSAWAGFERLEIGSVYTSKYIGRYEISIGPIANIGAADAVITAIDFNGKSPSDYMGTAFSYMPNDPRTAPIVIKAGSTLHEIKITISKEGGTTAPFTSGSSLTVTLHTASGLECRIIIVLP
jgi:hypothetical protein